MPHIEQEEQTTGLNRLIDLIKNNVNIAEGMGETKLLTVGQQVVRGYQADLDSMADWSETIDKGQELIKPEIHPKSEPWPNAANFKSPVITDASLKFGDRASSELLRGDEILKTKIIGKDPQQLKRQRAERVMTYMNWQLMSEMTEWVTEQNKLFYDLPYTGCIFKKIFFDSEKQRNMSELITYPAFAVNHNADSLDRARRFTHIMQFSKNEAIEKQRGGIWLDIELTTHDESDEGQAEQDEDDHISTYLEQQTYLDLDDDGYEEPYTVLVHLGSSRVVRITRRFDVDGVMVRSGDNEALLLSELVEVDDLGIPTSTPKGEHQIVKIAPLSNVVKYGFLHNPDGGLLDVGYFHLLSGTNAAINLTTNSLLNAGSLANMQGGWIAKNFREKLGNMRTKPGQYQQTNLSAQDLHTGIRDYSFKEPSPTLFQLMTFMLQTAEKTSASADLSGVLGANAPATTTLALVQEQQQSSGAIISRIYRSEAKEFNALYKLNSKFLDEEDYKRVTDDEEATIEDFNQTDMDIIPVANPEVSSKIQRIQLAQAELSQIGLVEATGGNTRPIVKNFFTALGTQNIDEIFPEPTEEELAAQAEAEALSQEEGEQLQNMQIDIAERQQANEDAKTVAEVGEREAKTVKLLEEAETEDTKNAVTTYTTALQLDQQQLALDQQLQDQQQLQSQQPQLVQGPTNVNSNTGQTQ